MTDFIAADQAETNGHTDGRDVILKTAYGEVPAFYDAEDEEPGWFSIAGCDVAMHVTGALAYRLPSEEEIAGFDQIERVGFPSITRT